MIGVFNYTVVLTYLGFISSIAGIVSAFTGNAKIAVICLLFSGLCDLFDDRIARTKKNRTKFEKEFVVQIDSISDIVSFGILPIMIGLSLNMSDLLYIPVYAIYGLAGLVRLGYLDSLVDNTNNKDSDLVGISISISSIMIPLLYLARRVSGFIYLYPFVLLVLAFIYISKFKVPKLNKKSMFFLIGIGLLEFILVLFLK